MAGIKQKNIIRTVLNGFTAEQLLYTVKYKFHCHLMVDAVNKQPVIKILILKLLKNEPVEVPKDDSVRLVPMCLCQCVWAPPSRGQKAPLGIHKAVSCICHPGRSTLGESTKLSLAYVTVTSRGAAHWGIHTLY